MLSRKIEQVSFVLAYMRMQPQVLVDLNLRAGKPSPIVAYTYFLDSSRVTLFSGLIFDSDDSFQMFIEMAGNCVVVSKVPSGFLT